MLATHSDISLSLLGAGATDEERAVLGAIPYNNNDIYLHTDETLMPVSRPHITSANTQVFNPVGWECKHTGRPEASGQCALIACLPASLPALLSLQAGCRLLLHTQLLAPAHLLLPVPVTCLFAPGAQGRVGQLELPGRQLHLNRCQQ